MPAIQTINGKVAGELSFDGAVSGDISTTAAVSGAISTAPRGGTQKGLPPGGSPGDILTKSTYTDYIVEWVTPASHAEQDNTRPITAAAVYTEIGNINALLATI